ncbi:MAG TPA: roadblock/LC7 domain-containing protein [Gaiellaceae bacterium]|jgi:predicted regulator of Ras-like GTPase activity (Roadblock/LC7/MglB family)
MDAPAVLERLREISSQVRSAVIFERGGKVLGSTLADEEHANRVAEEAAGLLDEAERRRANEGETEAEFAQLEVALRGGSVFVVRHDDRVIAATTSPEPTVGLVFYDLKSCLRELESSPPPKKAPARRRTTTARKKSEATEKKGEATGRKKSDAKP